jgi:hypothetical protein
MKRSDVEALFPESRGGIQGQTMTIYHQYLGAKVEVPFNNNGGSFSDENRVNGEARVIIEMAGNRYGIELQK